MYFKLLGWFSRKTVEEFDVLGWKSHSTIRDEFSRPFLGHTWKDAGRITGNGISAHEVSE